MGLDARFTYVIDSIYLLKVYTIYAYVMGTSKTVIGSYTTIT